MLKTLESRFKEALPAADFCSLRYVNEREEFIRVREDVPEPVQRSEDAGVMITVVRGQGMGYAATCDLSVSGLRAAARRAREWADKTAGHLVVDIHGLLPPAPMGELTGPQEVPWGSVPLADKFDLLLRQSRRLKTGDRIVDWEASLWHTSAEQLYITGDGGRVMQTFTYIVPNLSATANEGAETQTRSLGGRGYCRQGGMEVLGRVGFEDAAPELAAEAIELLSAPNCPTGEMDVVLDPGQMILQLHESVGHPLELDRILGDERNYAGTSFVTLDMFGTYRYGSELLNVCYDPTRPEEYASFGYDDDGVEAVKAYIIEKGILQRPLGSAISQARAGLPGVANSRASGWNRPPIDRMANLNIEPGTSRFDELIAAVQHGVYMRANRSWSIDDSRNKFQFGCEWARMIEDGRLTGVVKNPNYRGISATFWRSLAGVGDESTLDVMGTPHCGKGEPNQGVRVGHACPTCRFTHVQVFGGE